jgi:ribosomal protein S27AE
VASIKAECPRCGVVRLRVPDLTVRVCVDDERGAYRFHCPRCSDAVIHDASAAICALLVSVGVQEEVWRLPAELLEEHTGPMLTPDDLLDFHLLLEREDWAEGLAALTEDAPTP